MSECVRIMLAGFQRCLDPCKPLGKTLGYIVDDDRTRPFFRHHIEALTCNVDSRLPELPHFLQQIFCLEACQRLLYSGRCQTRDRHEAANTWMAPPGVEVGMRLNCVQHVQRVRPKFPSKARSVKVLLDGDKGRVNAPLHTLFRKEVCNSSRLKQDTPTDLDPCRQQFSRHIVVSRERHPKSLRTAM